MKKILAFILVIVMLAACCCQAEEQEKVKKEVTLDKVLDSVNFKSEEDKEISRKIIQYISLHAGTDVYWSYAFLGGVYFSIDGGKKYFISVREGMPDNENMNAVIEKNQEDLESMAKEPLGYFSLAEMEEIMSLCFEGTNLTFKQQKEALIIYNKDVDFGGVPLMYGPDGELYCRKVDFFLCIQRVGF